MILPGFCATLVFSLFCCLETAPFYQTSFNDILISVVRKSGFPDTLFPTVCPSACFQLFHANESMLNNSFSERCSCVCPPMAPIYLNTAGQCVDRLDECRHNLEFDSTIETERIIPVVSLPAKSGVILPRAPILWEGGGITVSPRRTVDCAISAMFVDNLEHRWKEVPHQTFDLSVANGRPVLMFSGSESDVTTLTGSVVQLKLSCSGFALEEHCLSFRVAGVSETNSDLFPSNSSRVELLFILVLLFLLVLSVVGSLVFWQMCWRIKKRKLISNIQMQFLFHLQQQQQEARKATALREAENMGTCEFGTLVERIPKRRLYFSTEYLEKEMMENPPPVAEQFLADLRRVIEIARERIKMRRFVPMLITIPEDLEESRNTVIQRTDAYDAADTNQQESPKSNKSVDSGRESRSDSDDSGRDDEEELRTKNWSEDRKCPDETNTICSAVGGLESNTAVQALELEQPSRVHSKIVPKSTRLPVSKMHTPLGRASPRPRQKSLTLQLSSPFGSDLPHRTPRELRARRGYAVFPADPILNKSLPRRKRAIPQFLGSSAASG